MRSMSVLKRGRAPLMSCNKYWSIFSDGPIMHHIQRMNALGDGKAFVDLLALHPVHMIQENWNKLLEDSQTETLNEVQIREFLSQNFGTHGWELEKIPELEGWEEHPPYLNHVTCELLRCLALNLQQLWKLLGVKVVEDVKHKADQTSMLYLPYSLVIPGGRFRENYYWDNYWIVKGLLASDLGNVAKGIIMNSFYLLSEYGMIPNGTRTYYLNRSQPPMLISMVKDYVEHTGETSVISDNIELMILEMNWWIEHRTVLVTKDSEVYRMFRYDAAGVGPRPESYREDMLTAESAGLVNDEDRESLFRNLKAAAESGWDFSSRWFVDENLENKGDLRNISTTHIVPVDLNAIMYRNYVVLSEMLETQGLHEKAVEFTILAKDLKSAITAVLYDESLRTWFDYDFVHERSRKFYYASNLTPLWAECYPAENKEGLGDAAALQLEEIGAILPGGVATSMHESGEQWDFPNVWAPCQHLIVDGLMKTEGEHAQRIALTIARNFVENAKVSPTGPDGMVRLYEKYDGRCIGSAGHGGEYEVQIGFGWTNGVVIEFIRSFGDFLSHTNCRMRIAVVYSGEAILREQTPQKHDIKPLKNQCAMLKVSQGSLLYIACETNVNRMVRLQFSIFRRRGFRSQLKHNLIILRSLGTSKQPRFAHYWDLDHPQTRKFIRKEQRAFQNNLSAIQFKRVHRELLTETQLQVSGAAKHLDRIRDYEYFMSYPDGENLPAFYRQHLVTKSRVPLLDLNTVGKELPKTKQIEPDYINLSEIKVSSNDRFLAFTLTTQPGEECFSLFVKDLVTGKFIGGAIEGVFSMEWGAANDLFYTVSNELARPYRVFCRSLEAETAEDPLIFEEHDPEFLVDVCKTRDEDYMVISSTSKSCSEAWVQATKEPEKKPFALVKKRNPGVQYFVEHYKDRFIIVTNDGFDGDFGLKDAHDSDIMKASNGTSWKTVYCSDCEQSLNPAPVFGVAELEVFKDFLVVYTRKQAQLRAHVLKFRDFDRDGHSRYHSYNIGFSSIYNSEIPFNCHPGVSMPYNSHQVHFRLTSMVEPETDCAFDTNRLDIFEVSDRTPQSSDLICKMVDVNNDNVDVPVTYAYSKQYAISEPRPLLLTVYGAYGIDNEPNYDKAHLFLMKRGWIIAHTHVRGGGEKGRNWYESGRAMQKWNTFTDFFAVANYFIDSQLSHPDIMAATANSAGALVLGVAANEHPWLFKAMVLKSPFLNVLDSMLNSELPLTSFEFDEWGNPEADPTAYDYIKTYDPIKNIEKMFQSDSSRPAMLITSSVSDRRVNFAGPAEYVSRLRELSPNSENIIFNTASESHFGSGGRYGQIEDKAIENAFLLHHITR